MFMLLILDNCMDVKIKILHDKNKCNTNVYHKVNIQGRHNVQKIITLYKTQIITMDDINNNNK